MFVDKFGSVRGRSNMAIGSPAGPENTQPGVPQPYPDTDRGSFGTVASCTIARAADLATVTLNSHGFAIGNVVRITGANQFQYNGDHRVETVPNGNTFTFIVYGTPTDPATGTITCAKHLLSALPDHVPFA